MREDMFAILATKGEVWKTDSCIPASPLISCGGEVLTAVTRNRVNTVNTRQVGEGEEGGLKHKV